MHSRVGSAIVQTELLGPGPDVLGTLHIMLATAPVRCCIATQVRWSVSPITFTTPFCMRYYEEIICIASFPTNTQKDDRSHLRIQLDWGLFLLCWLICFF